VEVLIATDVTARGGVDTYVRVLAGRARDWGHGITVALEKEAVSVWPTLDEASPPVRRCRLYHRWHAEEALARDAEDLLHGVQPDLLHVAAGVPWSCLPLREAACNLGIPQVVCEQFVPDTLEVTPDQAFRIRSLHREARMVVFVSEHNRQTMRRHLGLTGVNATVIHNAVDAAALSRDAIDAGVRAMRLRDRAHHGRVQLFAAGRFHRQKGFDLLLDACSMLRARGRRFQLSIFGEGPEGEALADQIRMRALESTVRLAPWQDDLRVVAAEYDVFVFPSRCEGMAYIVLEMMGRAVPIVATDVPSTAFALDGGRFGLLASCGDPAALAQTLDQVLMGSWDPEPVVRAAQHHVAEWFDEERQVSRTIACWEGESRDPPR
jgi:glycosyltransferase involved in cell wall biosynthesis